MALYNCFLTLRSVSGELGFRYFQTRPRHSSLQLFPQLHPTSYRISLEGYHGEMAGAK
jgi:hypothetical protein